MWKFLVCSAHAGPSSHRLFYRTGELESNLAVAVAGGLAWPAAVSCGRDVAGRVQAGTEAEVAGNRFRRASGPTVVCLLTFDSGAQACSFRCKNCIAAAQASEVIVNTVNCRHGCSRHF